MTFANKAFFDYCREKIFGGLLTETQVLNINIIVAAWAKYGDGNENDLAYCLGTTKWETAHTMQPIYERGAKSYFNKYEPGTSIGKRLGNTKKGDGYRYRGRGYVQLTGRRNYAFAGKELGLPLEENPDLALQPEVAARILIAGTHGGWFTGKGLGGYIDDVDESDAEDLREFVEARRTVNGKDKAAVIGDIALLFEKAIKAGKAAPPIPEPTPVTPTPKPKPKKDFWTVLIEFIVGLFTRKS